MTLTSQLVEKIDNAKKQWIRGGKKHNLECYLKLNGVYEFICEVENKEIKQGLILILATKCASCELGEEVHKWLNR